MQRKKEGKTERPTTPKPDKSKAFTMQVIKTRLFMVASSIIDPQIPFSYNQNKFICSTTKYQ